MESLKRKIVTPQSVLIEETAVKLACTMYEIGRSNGMSSKHKSAKAYARANLEKFVPLAIHTLLEMLSNPATPMEMKDLIYSAILERTNDEELNSSGIKAFENDTPYLPDLAKVYEKNVIDKHKRETEQLQEKRKDGQEKSIIIV